MTKELGKPPIAKASAPSLARRPTGYAEWLADVKVQQPVGQIPWGHNLVLLTKLKEQRTRLAYAASALEHGWSRAVLLHHIEARTEALPKNLEANLPSVEQIERELGELE